MDHLSFTVANVSLWIASSISKVDDNILTRQWYHFCVKRIKKLENQLFCYKSWCSSHTVRIRLFCHIFILHKSCGTKLSQRKLCEKPRIRKWNLKGKSFTTFLWIFWLHPLFLNDRKFIFHIQPKGILRSLYSPYFPFLF